MSRRRANRVRLPACFAIIVGLAQLPAQRELQAPTSVSRAEFAGIASVRELGDGRLLVADVVDNTLLLLSADLRDARSIAGVGRGPLEYQYVATLHALGEDSTVMSDPSNGRWLILDGAAVAGTTAPSDPVVALAGASVVGFDVNGNLLTTRSRGRFSIGPGLSVESLAVVRLHRGSLTADTIAGLRSNPAAVPANAGRNPMLNQAFSVELTGPDQALLFRDGWIALARQEPYRVEWIDPTGRPRGGVELPFDRVRVDDREKRAHAARLSEAAGRPVPATAMTRWPEWVYPFGRNALIAAPDGKLLIRRQRTAANDAVRYDVIDRSGRLQYSLRLSTRSRIVGSGTASVYVATASADGVERLSRHPW